MRTSTAFVVYTLLMLIAVAGCDDDGGTGTQPPTDYDYELEVAFPNLNFVRPVDLQNAGDNSGRLFVVELAGVIKVFDAGTAQSAKTFLDITSRVVSGAERGLLGLAFHPDYETNGYFYVYYTPVSTSVTRLARYEVTSGDPDLADAGSQVILMDIPQNADNHNGGQLAFGPDRYLYIAVGDGGGARDPGDHAQNLQTLKGSILRIDVDAQDAGNYGIPDTNPFALGTQGYRGEIYAYGLRNPWRFSFDPVTGRLWAGDVGQEVWEEIDIVEKGGNYGWDCYEGTHDLDEPQERSPACDTVATAIDPIYEYGHGTKNFSVTGGHVYRGPSLSSLTGVYVFADYSSGRIWGMGYDGNEVTPPAELVDADFRISSFGLDQARELYICAYDPTGTVTQIYKLKQVAK
jgi:glucose/arabinose dehydrogenase